MPARMPSSIARARPVSSISKVASQTMTWPPASAASLGKARQAMSPVPPATSTRRWPRRGLARRMSGRRIVQAELRRPDLRRPFPPMLAERLDGALIGALARRGKYILIELDETGLLLLHLGMSGRIIAGDANGADAKHDHVVLTLDDGTVVRLNDARRFGILDYLRRGEEATHPLLAGMGPEPLEPGFDGAYLSRALARKMTPIKSALLDQRIVAGLGNIY